MYHKLLSLILLTHFSTFIYAIDLNSTAIMHQATKATQPIQEKLNALLEENSTQPQEEFTTETTEVAHKEIPIIEQPIMVIAEESNSSSNSSIEKSLNPLTETNLTLKTVQDIPEDINSTTIEEVLNLTKGNTVRGKKIFMKHLKKECNTTAYKFAGNYAQEEWEEVAESGKFKDTLFKLCPNAKEIYNDSWSSHLYQFFYEHANDSENIPEC